MIANTMTMMKFGIVWRLFEVLQKPIYLLEKFSNGDSQKMGEIYEKMDIMSRGLYADEFHEVENIVLSRWDKMNIPMHCLVFALTPRFYDT